MACTEEDGLVRAYNSVGALRRLEAREERQVGPGAGDGADRGGHRIYTLGAIRVVQLWPQQVKTI